MAALDRAHGEADVRNMRSGAAIEALGAQFEGVFQRHMKIPGGWPDTAWYSAIRPEWPTVQDALRRRLARQGFTTYTPARWW